VVNHKMGMHLGVMGLVLCVGSGLFGCRGVRGPKVPTLPPGPVLPKRPHWPTVSPTSEERYKDALEVVHALADSPRRRKLRRSLQRYIGGRLAGALRKGQGVRGFALFLDLTGLYADVAADGGRRLGGTERGELAAAADRVLRTFARRGGAQESMTALAVLATVGGNGRSAMGRFDVIVHWLGELEDPLFGRVKRYVDPIAAVDKVYRRWPSPQVRHTLRVLLAQQYTSLQPLTRLPRAPKLRAVKQGIAAVREYGWQRVRLLTLARKDGQLAGTLIKVRRKAYGDEHLAQLLAPALAAKRTPAALITLAEAMAAKWPDAAQALCQRAVDRYPHDANAHYCLGRLALSDKHTLRALIHLEAAIRVNPGYRKAWDLYAATYLDRLLSLLGQERLEQVRREVRFLESVHRVAAAWWVNRPLKTSLADVYFMLGRGLYNEGRIGEAVTTLRKALKIKPTPQVQFQLAEIAFWRGRYEVSTGRLDAVLRHLKGNVGWRAYWEFRTAPLKTRARRRLAEQLRAKAKATVDRRTADRIRRQAKTEEARAVLLQSRALRSGQFLLRALRSPRLQAEVLVVVGQLLHATGRRQLALRSFDAALDRAPERSGTYVDVISFLVMRGYFDEALDAYHRALARSEISVYLKAYCTFWILDLGRRAKVDPERLGLAEVFLKHLKGKQWFHHLARFHLGKASYAHLARRAKTKGQRAELDFYQSMRLVQQGKVAQAQRLWQKIVDSEMMGFFEYKMVRRYLSQGVPTRPPQKQHKGKQP
jgi:tetratricopeptide (TPR) repeat protein